MIISQKRKSIAMKEVEASTNSTVMDSSGIPKMK
jgi:hypothetical protein